MPKRTLKKLFSPPTGTYKFVKTAANEVAQQLLEKPLLLVMN
jgi:hypothetical protein